MGRLSWLGWFAVVVVPFAALALLLLGVVPDPIMAVPIFHFFIVSLTCLLSILIALLMLVAAGQLKDARVFFLSLAFLSIAGIFLIHAFTTPGALIRSDNPWVGFTARLSLFSGSVFLGLSVIEWRRGVNAWITRYQVGVVSAIVVVIICFGVFAFTNAEAIGGTADSTASATTTSSSAGLGYGDFAPSSSYAAGEYGTTTLDPLDALFDSSLVSIGFTALTLGLYAFVCARLALLYRLSRRASLAGFLVTSVFLFQAQLSMVIAPAWHASWWEYHGLMFAALGATILGLILEYSDNPSLSGVVEGLLLRDTIGQLQRGYTDVVIALVEAVEAKDQYTSGHTRRVAELAVLIGEQLGMSPERLRTLHRAATLHDIGKIGVPDSILNKTATLSPEEFNVIKEHPARGHQIIRNVRSLQDEVGGVRWHHEWLDGTGYPDGLVGDEIPLEARIIAVADVFDALTSERAYRRAWQVEQAIEQVNRESGTKLDPRCVAALNQVYPVYLRYNQNKTRTSSSSRTG